MAEKKGRGLFCCCVLVGEKDGRMRVDEKLVEENVENGWLSMADAVLVVVWGVGFRLPILCLGRRVHRHGVRSGVKLRFILQNRKRENQQPEHQQIFMDKNETNAHLNFKIFTNLHAWGTLRKLFTLSFSFC